jgi:threonine/homoserine/homoserine lactone efflux protein
MLLAILFCLYFLPSFIAETKHHNNRNAILLCNLFLGWTFFGWVISLIWACINES